MLAAIIPSVAYTQLVADFDIVQNDNCAPAQITFLNHSTGQSTSEWDFGNGNTVTNNDLVVQQVYLNSGTYTITLHVTDGSGDDYISKNLTISDGPTAEFGVDYTTGCAGGDLHFSDSSVLGDAGIVSWSWDFRNGVLRNGQNQTVAFPESGTYDILLTVTDANNCTDYIEKTDFVRIAEQPVVNFIPDATSLCDIPASVSFTNTTVTDVTLDYNWNYGNGTIGNTVNGQANYTSEGNYMVTLTGTAEGGCYDVHAEEIHIQDLYNTNFRVYQYGEEVQDGEVICPGEITLVNLTGPSPNLEFVLSGGNTLSGDSVTYTLTQSGTFTVTLRSQQPNQCVTTSSKTFYIDNVKADFEITTDITCNFPLSVHFNNLSQNASVYIWRLAQGNSSFRENPDVVIENIYERGDYKVNGNIYYYENRLVVISPNGCRDTLLKNLEFIHPVAEDLTVSENRGCIPLGVELHDKSNSGNIQSRDWFFGDGSSLLNSTATEVNHTYTSAGEFNAYLVVTDDKNCRDTSDVFYIETGDVLEPEFDYSPHKLCYNDTLQLTDLTPDNDLIDAWHYTSTANIFNVCDDDSNPQAPLHATTIGNHDISLTVDYNGCMSSVTVPDAIYVRGPIASFIDTFSCEEPLHYYFVGDIEQASDISWEFGDLGSATGLSDVDHIYGLDGDYNVVLTTYNDITGCTGIYEREIYPRTVKASFTMDASDICLGDEHTYDATSSTGYNDKCFEAGFAWFFNEDWVPKITYNPTVDYGYGEKGSFNIILVVEDVNGCRDTATAPINVHMPDADFETDINSGCVPAMDVEFTNTSTDPSIVTWRFFFGDGDFVIDEMVHTHHYTSDEARTFNAGITVTDAYGCVDNLNKQLSMWKPNAAFMASETGICPGEHVTFTPSSSDYDQIFWKFGDDAYAEIPGSYTFNDPGSYDVGLIMVKDECRDTLLKPGYIEVQEADASFYTSDTVLNCYPQIITFTHTNTGDPVATGYWDFDFDGNTSGVYINPVSFAYSKPGVYHPSLHVETSSGCTDTKDMEVTVNGPYAEMDVSDIVPCIGDTVIFTMTDAQDVYDFQWIFGDGNSSVLNPAEHVYENENDYTVSLVISDVNGCVPPFITSDISVKNAYAEFDLRDGIYVFCEGDEIRIVNYSSGDTYIWRVDNNIVSQQQNPGDLSSFFEPGENYLSLEVQDGPGCLDTDSARIRIYVRPQLTVGNNQTICQGETAQLEAFVDAADGIQWEPHAEFNNATILNPQVQPETTTTYYIYVSNEYGCGSNDSVIVYVQENPEISRVPLEDTTIIYLGESITLTVSSNNASDYLWSPGSFLSCTECNMTLAGPDNNITYIATITDNCFVTTEQFVIFVIDPYIISLPDVFTPNGDGVNDMIYVRGQGIGELLEFKIFNRWGNLVYSSNDITEGWDGYYKGKLQNTDIYTYVVRIITEREREIEQRGTFHLIL